jgi:hypothetical protein
MVVGAMWPWFLRLTLAISFLIVWASAAGAVAQAPKTADPNGRISFHTLDNDVQQVDIDEIWRVRGAAGRDEPARTIVIDYAFERLFVEGSLEDIIAKIRDKSRIVKFTLPSGAPVYIVTDKVIGITRAIRSQHHPNSKSIIIAREGEQQVQESREAVREALRR